MESPPTEVSPVPYSRGLKGVLAKARRGGKESSYTLSINGTENSSDSHGIRSSAESLQYKERTSREPSIDDGSTTNRSRPLAKLIPARIKKKLRKQEREEDKGEDGEEGQQTDGRGCIILDPVATSTDTKRPTDNRSQSTLGDSSPITYDSDETESPVISPPSLRSHPSHAGYLTSSSPLIKTSTRIEHPATFPSDEFTTDPSQAQKSTTFPVSNSNPPTDTNLAPRHAVTLDSRQSETSLGMAEASTSDSRGVSPGSRIKGVFASAPRRKESPSTASLKSSENGDTLGGSSGIGQVENRADLPKGPRSKNTPGAAQPSKSETNSPNTSSREPLSITNSPALSSSSGPDAPLTTVTPPTPTDQRPEPLTREMTKDQQPILPGINQNSVIPASGNTLSHRRARSESTAHAPSKLSNAMSVPLTPTIEETKTLGSRTPISQGLPGGGSGFFSSVFSMAQNATNSFITNNTQSRPRSSIPIVDEDNNRETETSSMINTVGEENPAVERKRLAIDTLGTGDLSLSHLGITGDSPAVDNPSTEIVPTITDGTSERVKGAPSVRRDEAAARVEDNSASRAISAAYGENAQNDKYATHITGDNTPGVINKPAYDSSIAGERTPPKGSVVEGEQNTRRSGSVRSRVGAVTRRHRNSSSATGNTIGTIHAVSQATLANALTSNSTHKLTGFAVASKKRNRDFHQLFRSIPEDDYLIEDYSCALQREIIVAGRVYVSEGHICFSSNILGWITTVIISFDEIVSVEKENTAMVFPNAIAIQTLHARHTFRSLLSREATYELLIGIWKLSHPSLKSSLNGVRLDAGGTGDKTEKVDPSSSDDPSDISEEEEVYDEDEEEDDGLGSFTEAGNLSDDGSEGNDPASKNVTRKATAIGVAIGSAAGGLPAASESKAGEKAGAAAAASVDFPGPATHPPTECNDGDTHFDKVVKDEIIPAPLGKVYSMVFGAASGGFMTRWFIDEQKFMDLHMEDDKKGLSEENRTRSYSYIKPLYGSIGPKQTKCITTEYLDFIDFEKAVSVSVVTQTPDVPNGNLFKTKTKYCLTWAHGNSTRLFVNCTIEWAGKSWLRVPIEKGANEGQTSYATDLVRALKAGILSRSRAGTTNSKLKVKGRRKRTGLDSPKQPEVEEMIESRSRGQDSPWSLMEQLHGILGPVVDIFSSIINKNMVIGFLTLLLLTTWLWGSTPSSKGPVGIRGLATPERIAAYEEIWRREESSLWDWLEERIGMEGIAYPTSGGKDHEVLQNARKHREQSLKHRDADPIIMDETMDEREFADAIKGMEERLGALKSAIEKNEKNNRRVAEEGK